MKSGFFNKKSSRIIIISAVFVTMVIDIIIVKQIGFVFLPMFLMSLIFFLISFLIGLMFKLIIKGYFERTVK